MNTMYLVTYICIKLSNYLDIYYVPEKYEDIKNTKQTTYDVVVKSTLLHVQKTRSSYHTRTLSNGSSK